MALNVVPNAGQSLAVTRDPIRNNFGTINAAFLVDHVEYNLADQGKHKQVTFPNNPAPAAPIANEIKLYNATNGGIPQLFVQRVAAPAINIPFTQANAAGQGYTYLPSGMLLKWGSVLQPLAGNNAPIVFPGPAFTAVYNGQLTSQTAGTAFTVFNLIPASITVNASVGGGVVYYFVIGT